ncbi:platelet-derived growth factor receptor alpha-like [Tachyglossus aculeatus]|uniref:platelet-derived growth factor receptor alpha-like n=1 Tax=Tachyglossus aculeatus TaxID=9261 RepID=UPI0018F72517|nr:platelet-derived growth factor receptor alpha-like [Tachyglossus aculeatus]
MPPSTSAGPGSGDQSGRRGPAGRGFSVNNGSFPMDIPGLGVSAVRSGDSPKEGTPKLKDGTPTAEGPVRLDRLQLASPLPRAATRSLPVPGSRHDAKQGGAGVAPEQVSLWDSENSWRFPTLDDESSGVSIRSEKNNCSNFLSVLEVANVSAVHTGLYTCYYNDTQGQGTGIVGRNIYVYVPEPNVTFVPSVMVDYFSVVEESNSTVIPCSPTDPQAQVTLHASDGKEVSATYDRRRGFLVSQEIVLEMEAPKTVYKTGETIVVTCSVLDIELVDFQWNYPGEAVQGQGRRQDGKITVPSVKLVFILTVPNATAKDRGSYECAVGHITREVQQTKVVTIAVLEKGFIWLQPVSDPVEAVNLQAVWHFDVDLEAYPPPRVFWLKNNESLTKNTTGITTSLQKTHEYRYQSRLKLIRAKEEDRGHYTTVVQNEDDIARCTFELRVHVPAYILDLVDDPHGSEGRQTVRCVAEGIPLPDIDWLVCADIKMYAEQPTKPDHFLFPGPGLRVCTGGLSTTVLGEWRDDQQSVRGPAGVSGVVGGMLDKSCLPPASASASPLSPGAKMMEEK